MTGGLLQLVANGIEDIFLINNPEITFFKVVYRRHTNFSTEVIPQYFKHKPDFGKRISCILSKNGDLIRKMHLVIALPSIPVFKDDNGCIDPLLKFAWTRRIGYVIIKRVEIEIGGQIVDCQYGEWLNIWYELTVPKNKTLNKIIGDIKELTDYSNGKKGYKLFIPLQFWFNRNTGLSLPLVALNSNEVKINLELNDLEKCFILAPSHYMLLDNNIVNFEPFEYICQANDTGLAQAQFVHFDFISKYLYYLKLSKTGFKCVEEHNIPICGKNSKFEAQPAKKSVERIYKVRTHKFKNISLKDCFLLVEYIFLDTEERLKFSQSSHEYLIEQLLYSGEIVLESMHRTFDLGFNHPCKELFWVVQSGCSEQNNDHFNYSDNNDCLKGESLIEKETILFDNLERLSFRDSAYFNYIQPLENHSNTPSVGINCYSFALHAEKHQPSGSANLSKMQNISIKITAKNSINNQNTAKFRAYGLVLNILRIATGMSGLLFK